MKCPLNDKDLRITVYPMLKWALETFERPDLRKNIQ
jgi:hypothetical protein